MSEHTKARRIDKQIAVVVQDNPQKTFLIPPRVMPKLFKFLAPFIVSDDDDELIPADEVFKDLYEKYGKVGSTIRGYRSRDNMTQAELAQKLNIHQSHVSQMEHSKRVIGKKMAHKLAKIFNSDYRLFL